MDFLSPSAAVDFQERTTPDLSQVGSQLGLSPEELDQIIRQVTGLKLSPSQVQQGEIAQAGNLPALMNAFTNQAEIPIKQQEANIKGDQAKVASREAKVKEDAQTLAQAKFDTLDEAEQGQRLTNFLTTQAMAGNNRALLVLKGIRAEPLMDELVRGFIKEGKFKEAADFIGVPEGIVKDQLWLGVTVDREKLDAAGLGGAPIARSTGQLPTMEENLQKALEALGALEDPVTTPNQ